MLIGVKKIHSPNFSLNKSQHIAPMARLAPLGGAGARFAFRWLFYKHIAPAALIYTLAILILHRTKAGYIYHPD